MAHSLRHMSGDCRGRDIFEDAVLVFLRAASSGLARPQPFIFSYHSETPPSPPPLQGEGQNGIHSGSFQNATIIRGCNGLPRRLTCHCQVFPPDISCKVCLPRRAMVARGWLFSSGVVLPKWSSLWYRVAVRPPGAGRRPSCLPAFARFGGLNFQSATRLMLIC